MPKAVQDFSRSRLRMRILLTRPREDAARVAEKLKLQHHIIDIEPLLTIHYLDTPPNLDHIQALLFTSANGVRAFARLEETRVWPVFAVGQQTSQQAEDMGFRHISSANGDSRDLARLVRAQLKPEKGPLFHGTSKTSPGALRKELEEHGFVVHREFLYEAIAAKEFSVAASSALKKGLYDIVLFFSPRTARIFKELCIKESMPRFPSSTALCLSKAIGVELGELGFKSIEIAQNPDLPSLMGLMDSIIRKR